MGFEMEFIDNLKQNIRESVNSLVGVAPSELSLSGESPLSARTNGSNSLIGGKVTFSYKDKQGDIVIVFNESDYLKLVSLIIGEEQKKLDDTNGDWGAELLNLICSATKAQCNKNEKTFAMSIPSVINGVVRESLVNSKTRVYKVKYKVQDLEFLFDILV